MLTQLNPEDYDEHELKSLRLLFQAARQRNRQKLMVALVGLVATEETLQAIEAQLAKTAELSNRK